MNVLVTGGAGFIGSNLCRYLAYAPQIDNVRVLDDLSTGTEANLDGTGATFYHGSILDATMLSDAISGCQSVVHLAAVPSIPRSITDPLTSHNANATGTLRVLEAARKEGNVHVIIASSSSVYGSNPILPKAEHLQCVPTSPYAVSKLAAESYAVAYARCYELPVLPFRFFNVFGPRQTAGHAYAAVIPAFVDAAINRRPLPLYGDGTQSRDFTFIDTVTSVLTDAVVRRVCHGPVNLAFGTRTALLDLIAILENVLGYKLAIDNFPIRPGDVPHSQADNSLLRRLFPGVIPTELRAGIERTVQWTSTQIA